MGKTVNRTKSANIKCDNCKYLKPISIEGQSANLCKANNTLVDKWDKCKKFEWREDKSYSDTPDVNPGRQ